MREPAGGPRTKLLTRDPISLGVSLQPSLGRANFSFFLHGLLGSSTVVPFVGESRYSYLCGYHTVLYRRGSHHGLCGPLHVVVSNSRVPSTFFSSVTSTSAYVTPHLHILSLFSLTSLRVSRFAGPSKLPIYETDTCSSKTATPRIVVRQSHFVAIYTKQT